eukprot:1169202-Pyramimonas_sp.AAC.1
MHRNYASPPCLKQRTSAVAVNTITGLFKAKPFDAAHTTFVGKQCHGALQCVMNGRLCTFLKRAAPEGTYHAKGSCTYERAHRCLKLGGGGGTFAR